MFWDSSWHQTMRPAPATGAQTKAQIRAAMTNLDVRLANGEISEATYNRLYENLSKALETAPE